MKYSDVMRSHLRLINRTVGKDHPVNVGWSEGEGYISSKLYPGVATTYYDPETYHIDHHEVEGLRG